MKFIVKYVIPIAALFFLFNYNLFAGILVTLLFVLYQVYNNLWYLYSRKGLIKYHEGDMAAAVQYFKKSYNTGKAPVSTGLSYAYVTLKAGDVESAEKILNKLYSGRLTADEKLKLKSNEALVVWKKGNLEQAIEMLREVMQEYKSTILYGSLGYLLVLQGDTESALAFNLEAYEYNNEDTTILDNLGQAYYFAHDYDNALKIYEQLMALEPKFPEAYYNYGLTLESLGQKEQALLNVKKALNYKTNYLSGLTTAEIESKIKQLL